MLNVILTGITSFFTDVSSEMVYPLVPLYLTISLGAKPFTVGIIEGIAESLAALLKVFSGRISDKLGKRKSLAISGYSFSTIGKLILYSSTSWTGVLAGRIVDRFGKGIRTAPRDAIIADSTDEKIRGKAYGLHRTLDTLGSCTGIIFAYLFLSLAKENYKTMFLLSLIPASLGVIVLFFVREKTRISSPTPSPINGEGKCRDDTQGDLSPLNPALKCSRKTGSWRNLDTKLKAFLIITFIFTLGNSSNMFILLRAKHLGFNSTNVILLYLLFNIVYALSSYPAGVMSDKIGRKKLITAGYFAYALVYLFLALINKAYFMWLIMGIYGLYIGFTEGVEKAFICDIAPCENRATLFGLHATLLGIGLFPASFIAGILWNLLGASAPFYFGAFMGGIASFGFLLLL